MLNATLLKIHVEEYGKWKAYSRTANFSTNLTPKNLFYEVDLRKEVYLQKLKWDQ